MQIFRISVSTVVGMPDNLFIVLAGKKVLAMQGRFHYYEGHNIRVWRLSVRVMA